MGTISSVSILVGGHGSLVQVVCRNTLRQRSKIPLTVGSKL